MNFEEWWGGKFHYVESWEIAGIMKHTADEAWGAAIDEAVKVIRDCSDEYDGTKIMAKKLKELK